MQSATAVHPPTWTPREREVLDLIAGGHTNGEIAVRLGITFPTAKWHVSQVISKCGLASREEVAAYWKHETRPATRALRTARAATSGLLVKLSLGVGVAAAAGTAILFATDVFGPAGSQDVVAAVVTDETATPASTPTVAPVNCPSRPFGADNLCRYNDIPALAALDRGGCDLSGQPIGATFLAVVIANGGLAPNVDLSRCNLRGAIFEDAPLNGASFERSDLRDARFDRSTVGGGNFTGADLRGASVRAVVAGANFKDANLEGSTFEAIQADTAIWSNTTCPDGTNSDAHGRTCIGWGVINRDPSHGVVELRCPPAAATTETGAACPRGSYPALQLLGQTNTCNLRYANLAGAHLERADLAGCDLTGANLSRAWLNGAVLDGATVEGADLSGVHLAGARTDRMVWRNTVCPDGANSDVEDGDGGTCLANLAR